MELNLLKTPMGYINSLGLQYMEVRRYSMKGFPYILLIRNDVEHIYGELMNGGGCCIEREKKGGLRFVKEKRRCRWIGI